MIPDIATLALTCLLLLAAGYVLLTVLLFVPSLSATAKDAWPILLTETLIVGVAAGAIWFGGWVLTVALLALVFRCTWEAASICSYRRPPLTRSPLALASVTTLLAIIVSLIPVLVGASGLFIAAAASTLFIIVRNLNDSPNLKITAELALFPILPLILFVSAGLRGEYGAWLLIAFILVETFDSYALLGGKLFGRTKAFPVLSPRKTVEGLLIGAAMLMLTAAVLGAFMGLPVVASSAVALFVGGLTIAGDLAASAVKRRSGVKDFPPVLPLQGGLLDITDAWIAAGAGLVVLVTLAGLV